jgi:uncharacterized protein (DUF58 family)
MEDIHYRLPLRVRGHHPGFHRSNTAGGGHEFREYESLLRARDPRRLDVHASLKNASGGLLVRTFNQRSAITVSVVADLSASMGAPGERGKLDQLAKLVRLLGFSVSRTGDRFGFVGCDARVRTELLFPPARWSSFGEIADRLDRFVPDASSCEGLAASGNYLGASRGLVFLVSDYLFPEAFLNEIFRSLGRHVLVPVMLARAADVEGPSASGLVSAMDSETGHSRLVWLRPSLRARIREAYSLHRQRLEHACERHGLKPLLLTDSFGADDVTRYFYPVDTGRWVARR